MAPLIYPSGDAQETVNLGLATWGMDETVAQNFILIDAFAAGPFGATVKINGTAFAALNFNNTTPAAPGGDTNVTFQVDAFGNVSGYAPTGVASVAWSSITNAIANLTLSNAGFNTTFNQTSAAQWLWYNTTPATVLTANSSPIVTLSENYWNGSASAQGEWTLQAGVTAGSNGTSTLTIGHTGSTGPLFVSVPEDMLIHGMTVGLGPSAVATNVAFGASALASNTTGSQNTAIGLNALTSITTGGFNVAIGGDALHFDILGSSNIAIGQGALYNGTGNSNTAIGVSVLGSYASSFNTAIGAGAMAGATVTGSLNTAIGDSALFVNSAGAQNVGIGFQAGYTAIAGNANTTGSNNTWIGSLSGPGTSTQLTNATAIGYQALNTASNQVVLGNSSVTSLVINGATHLGATAALYDSAGSAGSVGNALTVNASGNPVWSASAGSGTVTSVSFTGGLISVATATSTPALTVAGTSGGIPYFSSASTWASSALLSSTGVVLGGGAGTAPQTTTHLVFSSDTLSIGLSGTSSGVIALQGVTSGQATITAPSVAGTVTNSITISNSLQLPSGTVYKISTDSGISRIGTASLAVGNGSAGDISGNLSASSVTLTGAATGVAIYMAPGVAAFRDSSGSPSSSDTFYFDMPIMVVRDPSNGYSVSATITKSSIQCPSVAINGTVASPTAGTYYSGGTAGITQTAIAVGTLATTGGLVTTFTGVSDERLKNFTLYKGGLAEILAITPIRFTYNELGQKFGGWDKEHIYVGFSAQNVQKSIPEAIQGTEGVEKYLSFDDRPVIAAAVCAIKELHAIIQAQSERIKLLEGR
jgi:hypothetical protein